jgi:GNAT superfamily N-acetyltransferase
MTMPPARVPSDLRVRTYRAEDRAAVLAIFDSNVPEFFTITERVDFAAFLNQLSGPYFVIEVPNGGVVACGGYALVPEECRADLCWGMVLRSRHGRGIGRFLTELRVEAARADDRVHHVVLNTSHLTREFYERLGFITERVAVDGFSPGLDRVDMRLAIR